MNDTPISTDTGTAQQPATDTANNQKNEIAATADTAVSPDIETLLAEAEQRGYLRGRNEAIEQFINSPGDNALEVIPGDDDNEILIFEVFPRSIWD